MTGLLTDPWYKRHKPSPEHPERPERLEAILLELEHSGLRERLRPIPARAATDDEVLLCHAPEYLQVVRHDIAQGASTLSTGDTEIGPWSLEVAQKAVGGVLNAVDAVMDRRVANAFCAVRPPGHHAGRDRGMGFCIFNNVALAARYAQTRHGIERVLIADWDVHHGNGTQEIFYGDPGVFFFSTHQYPWYPGTGWIDETGEGAGKGFTLNCPLPAGSGRAEIYGAFEQMLVPAMKNFRPELVLISAGFDSRHGDPLGRFQLADADFADLTRLMADLAERYAGGRLLSVLEGGYNLGGLAAAAGAHVKALTV